MARGGKLGLRVLQSGTDGGVSTGARDGANRCFKRSEAVGKSLVECGRRVIRNKAGLIRIRGHAGELEVMNEIAARETGVVVRDTRHRARAINYEHHVHLRETTDGGDKGRSVVRIVSVVLGTQSLCIIGNVLTDLCRAADASLKGHRSACARRNVSEVPKDGVSRKPASAEVVRLGDDLRWEDVANL